jgi:hypothetical protein
MTRQETVPAVSVKARRMPRQQDVMLRRHTVGAQAVGEVVELQRVSSALTASM